MITNNLWSFTDISQFQLIQTGEKSYKLHLNVPATFSRHEEVKGLFHSLLGDDALIEVRCVDEIPVLASGKRRYIINEWKANAKR